MLKFGGEYGVEDPVEAEDGVNDHGEVVEARVLVAKDVAKEGIFGVRVEETPVHSKIPDGAINGINGSANNKQCFEVGRLMKPVDAEGHVE